MKNYKLLIMELETHIKLRDGLEVNWKYWTNQFDNSGPREIKGQNYANLDMPRGSSDDSTLDKIVYNMNHFWNLIVMENEYIENMQTNLDGVNAAIKECDNIYSKVAYLKYQKNEDGRKKYTLAQIAEMLGYSEDWIKEVSARV